MFLMIGVTQGEKQLDVQQPILCGRCGKYGRFEVFVAYSQLLLFFLPVFRWNKRYWARTSCCGACYELPRELGRRIEEGGGPELDQSTLGEAVSSGYWPPEDDWIGGAKQWSSLKEKRRNADGRCRRCPACGFTTGEDYDYCPKCGRPLE